jgi:hypothetical protein
VKLSHIALGIAGLIATFSTLASTLASTPASTLTDAQPTCRWLHLDGETRVFQCAILATSQSESAPTAGDALPDPTLPLAQQKTRQTQSDHYPIPAFLRASLPAVEAQTSGAKSEANAFTIEKRAEAPKITPESTIDLAGAPSKELSKELSKERFKKQQTLQQTPHQTPHLTKAVAAVETDLGDGPFMVLARGDVKALEAQLDAAGEHHYMVLRSSGELSLGVYSTIDAAEKRRDSLATIGVDSDLTALNRAASSALAEVPNKSKASQGNRVITGYLVATLGDQQRIIEQLEHVGAKDFVALNVDPYRNRVSLGVYSSYENALARQDKFKQLGVDSELILRNESTVVRTTLKLESRDKAPVYGFDQLALNLTEI